MLVISNRPCASRLSNFEIYWRDYSLNCAPLGPIIITNLSEIIHVISKSNERAARVLFEITYDF